MVTLTAHEPAPSSSPVAPHGRRRLRGRTTQTLRNSALGIPLIVVVTGLVLVPIGFLVYAALSTGSPGSRGNELTFVNVVRVFGTTEFLVPLRNSLVLATAVAAASLVIGVLLAWLVTKTGMKRARMWENLLIVPVYLSPLMLALAYVAIAAPRVGFLNLLLPESLRVLSIYNFGGLVWVMTASYAGYVLLYMVGPIRALNAELEEAALVLGSGRWQILRRVILPLLGPAMLASFVIVFTLAAENFAVPSLLGSTFGFPTIPSEIYYLVQSTPSDPNLAAALGIMLLILTFVGIAIYRRMIRIASRYETVGGKPRATRAFQVRRFRWVPTAIVVTWLVVALVLPFAGLVVGSLMKFISSNIDPSDFTLANYRKVFEGPGLQAIGNTLLMSIVAGTVAAFLGALVSYTVMRTKSVGRSYLDYVSTATVAIPGLTLAIGLLWVYVRLPLPIYGTVWMLVIAFITRFLAHSVRVSSVTLLPISPQLDEAGRVLGAGMARRLATITLPLMRPGIVSAWMLIFIFATNEVSAAVLLYTPASQNIAVRVWTSVQTQGSIQAFAYATVQSVIIAIVLLAIYRIFGYVDPEGGQAQGRAQKRAAKGATAR